MPAFTLRLLGGFEAAHDGVVVTHFPTDKIRALLAYLAVESQQAHRRSQLATLLWGDWEEAAAMANLRKSLFRLRKTLDALAPGYGDELLAVSRADVQLRPAALSVDVLTLRELLRAVADHAHGHLANCELCLHRLGEVDRLYGGDLLAGLSVDEAPEFEAWLTVRRERLHEHVLGALAALAEAHLQRGSQNSAGSSGLGGEYELARHFAARQLALEPWREMAHRQLMRVYAAQGRREEAVAQYERCLLALDAALGITPSAETTQLLQAIAEGTWEEASPGAAASGPWLHHFPTTATPFIGRHADVDAVHERLHDPACRLLTLIGAGGIGKTRLAAEALRCFGDGPALFDGGAYFIPLAAVTTAERLVAAVGEGLGLVFRQGTPLEDQVVAALGERPVLLVLDNYEQLLPHTALIERILVQAPQAAIMTTSRVPLNLHAEWRVPLAGLPVPEGALPLEEMAEHAAVQLFSSAARRIDPAFKLDEGSSPHVAAICRDLAGMPLALEIAASWLKVHALPVLAARIAVGVAFLTAHARDIPERHRSLQVVFEQSWHLLRPPERAAFARLTCFEGSFELEAALSVAELSMAALITLLEHTLVQRLPDERYSLHPVLQQFARAHVTQPEPLFARHAAWYLGRVAQVAPRFTTGRAPEAVALIAADLDNVRRAWQWAVGQRRGDLLAPALDGLLSFYQFRGLYSEGREHFAAAVSALAPDPAAAVAANRMRLAQATCETSLGNIDTAVALTRQVAGADDGETYTAAVTALGKLHLLQADNAEALAYLEEARRLLTPLGDSRELAEVLDHTGELYRYTNRVDDGIAVVGEALAINHRLGNEAGAAQDHANLALLYKDISDYTQAIRHVGAAITVSEKLGHRENVARFTQNLGLIYWQMDDLPQALACYQKALTIAEELQSKRGIAMCTGGIGVMMRRMYRYNEALDAYAHALALAEELGDKSMQATLLGNTGNVYMDLGEKRLALDYLQRAAALDRAIGSGGGAGRHLGNIGDTLKMHGEYDAALPYFEAGIPILRNIDAKYYLSWQLVAYGEALYALSRLREARAAADEGVTIAVESGRKPYEFLGRLLLARLDAAEGDTASALRQLDDLQDHYTGDEEEAELAVARWELSGRDADGRDAIRRLQTIVDKSGLYRHRRQLERLRRHLTVRSG